MGSFHFISGATESVWRELSMGVTKFVPQEIAITALQGTNSKGRRMEGGRPVTRVSQRFRQEIMVFCTSCCEWSGQNPDMSGSRACSTWTCCGIGDRCHIPRQKRRERTSLETPTRFFLGGHVNSDLRDLWFQVVFRSWTWARSLSMRRTWICIQWWVTEIDFTVWLEKIFCYFIISPTLAFSDIFCYIKVLLWNVSWILLFFP